MIDIKGKKCKICSKGTYEETSIQDDWNGILHCNNCGWAVEGKKISKNKKNKGFEDCNIERERTINFADHEVLLAFINDDDAGYFREWFECDGRKLFKKYLDKQKH